MKKTLILNTSNPKTLKVGVFLLLATLLFVCWFNIPYGHHPSDDGCMMAMAWRILHSEVPFRDYTTLRMPLTHIIHTVWFILPEKLQFWGSRFGFYFWIWLTGLVPLILILPTRTTNPYRMTLVLCMTLMGLLYASHNFPPTPWTSVDGITLSALGLSFLGAAWSRPTFKGFSLYLSIAGFFCGLAPLAKQNFGLIPAFYLATVSLYLYLREEPLCRKLNAFFISFISLGLPLLVFVIYLRKNHALHDFKYQITILSGTGYLLESIIKYAPLTPKNFLLSAAGAGVGVFGTLAQKFNSKKQDWIQPLWILIPWVLILYAIVVFLDLKQIDALYRSTSLFRFFYGFLFGCIVTGYKNYSKDLGKTVFAVGSIFLSWFAAMSIGYDMPILAFGPLCFSVGLYLSEFKISQTPLQGCAALFGAGALIAVISHSRLNYVRPYNQPIRSEQTFDLSEIYPKFGYKMTTDSVTYDRYQKLKAISQEVERTFPSRAQIVMPHFPMFYFLSNRINPTSVDWWLHLEVDFFTDRLIEQIKRYHPIILAELEISDRNCTSFVEPAQMIRWVAANGHPIARNSRFCAIATSDQLAPGKKSILVESLQ